MQVIYQIVQRQNNKWSSCLVVIFECLCYFLNYIRKYTRLTGHTELYIYIIRTYIANSLQSVNKISVLAIKTM